MKLNKMKMKSMWKTFTIVLKANNRKKTPKQITKHTRAKSNNDNNFGR